MTDLRSRFTAIEDAGDPRLAAYRSLKGKELERQGIFIAEGEKVVKSLKKSGCRVFSTLFAKELLPRFKPLLIAMAKQGAAIYQAPLKTIEEIIGFRFHQGIMAVAQCPEKRTVAIALKAPGRKRLLVALNGVNDPQNVGLIVRNAVAFGADGLIVDRMTYDPYYRKAVRVSMGTIFGLPVFYERDLVSSLSWLKLNHGTRIIAATPGRGGIDIDSVEFSGNACLVFGNEDKGISAGVLRIADALVRIPIAKGVDSLNVASASAVILHAARQKGRHVAKVYVKPA